MKKLITKIKQKVIRKLGGYVEPFPGPQQQLPEYRTVCVPVVLKVGCNVRYDCSEERVEEIIAEQFVKTLYEKGYIKIVRSEGIVNGFIEYNAYLKVIKEE